MIDRISTRSILFFLWNIVVFAITLYPGDNMPDKGIWSIPYLDKAGHALTFTVYAYLLAGFADINLLMKIGRIRAFLLVVGLSLVVGLMIEFLQLLVPGRSFEYFDILANFTGSLAGYLLFSMKNISGAS